MDHEHYMRLALAQAALAREVGHPLRARDEEQIRDRIHDAPVHLLRHRPVERAEARLHVGERHERLRAHERGRERGVHVPVDDDERGARRGVGRGEDRLERDEERGGLAGLAPRADAEAHVRRGQVITPLTWEALQQFGLIPSMSRRGNCYVNAPMESFYHSLKTELVQFSKGFKNKLEAKTLIAEYIEEYYNLVRRHSAIAYQAPIVFELSTSRS